MCDMHVAVLVLKKMVLWRTVMPMAAAMLMVNLSRTFEVIGGNTKILKSLFDEVQGCKDELPGTILAS